MVVRVELVGILAFFLGIVNGFVVVPIDHIKAASHSVPYSWSDDSHNGYWSSLVRCQSTLYETMQEPNIESDASTFELCWATNTITVNPTNDIKIDTILQGLVSPAPQSFFVLQRVLNLLHLKHDTNPDNAIEDVNNVAGNICYHLLKQKSRLWIRKKLSATMQPGIDWTIQASGTPLLPGWCIPEMSDSICSESCQQMAGDILRVVIDASEFQIPVDTDLIDTMVDALERRLDLTLGTDLRGRAGADTLFKLALAGVTS